MKKDFEIPSKSTIKRLEKEKHLSDSYPTKPVTLISTEVSGDVCHVTVLLQPENTIEEVKIGSWSKVGLQIDIPDDPTDSSWKIGSQVTCKLDQLHLNMNIGNMLVLDQILSDNSDEISPFVKIASNWYKKVDMNLLVERGDLQITDLRLPRPNANP